jgi:hypothetical protein
MAKTTALLESGESNPNIEIYIASSQVSYTMEGKTAVTCESVIGAQTMYIKGLNCHQNIKRRNLLRHLVKPVF